VDAFPIWGDICHLCASDRCPAAVPFLIAMCHEPPSPFCGSMSVVGIFQQLLVESVGLLFLSANFPLPK